MVQWKNKHNGEFIHEHQIQTNFDGLNKIRHVQAFSETVKQNLSHKAKGFGNAKKAINLVLWKWIEFTFTMLDQRKGKGIWW